MIPNLRTTNHHELGKETNISEIFWCEPADYGKLTSLSIWRSESAPSGKAIINFHYKKHNYTLIQNHSEIQSGLLRYLDDSVSYAKKSNQDLDFLKIDTGANGEALLYDLRGN